MHNQFKTQKFKHLMLAMGPRDLNSAPYSPVHCSSHSMMSFQSSELTELPVVENSQLFAQRVHSARTAHGTPPYTPLHLGHSDGDGQPPACHQEAMQCALSAAAPLGTRLDCNAGTGRHPSTRVSPTCARALAGSARRTPGLTWCRMVATLQCVPGRPTSSARLVGDGAMRRPRDQTPRPVHWTLAVTERRLLDKGRDRDALELGYGAMNLPPPPGSTGSKVPKSTLPRYTH